MLLSVFLIFMNRAEKSLSVIRGIDKRGRLMFFHWWIFWVYFLGFIFIFNISCFCNFNIIRAF
jgi:hypothetical protein